MNKTDSYMSSLTQEEISEAEQTAKEIEALSRVVNEAADRLHVVENKWKALINNMALQLNNNTRPGNNLALPDLMIKAGEELRTFTTHYNERRAEYYAARHALNRLRGEPEED